MPGAVLDLAVSGNLLAVACDFAGVQLVDISSTDSPQVIAQIDTSSLAFRVLVNGNLCYILTKLLFGGNDHSTLSIYDCSDSASPQLYGELALPTDTKDIALAGTYVYAANRESGLIVIDVSNPSQPVQIAELYEGLGALAINTVNGVAYVAQGGYGVGVFDLSSPDNPQLVDYLDLDGSSEQIVPVDNYLYVATYSNGVHILDTSDPLHPSLLSTVDAGASLLHMGGDASFLFYSSITNGLTIYGLTDPENPKLLAGVMLPGDAYNVIKTGTTLLVNEYPLGIRIYAISTDYELTAINLIPVEERFVMAVREPYLFVCESQSGNLRIYDFSDRLHISEISSVSLGGDVTEIAVNNSTLFFSSRQGVRIVDITNLNDPTILPTIPYPCNSLAVHGSFLAITLAFESQPGVKIFDVSDLENPILLNEWGIYYFDNIAIDEHYAYIGSSDDLYVLDYQQDNVIVTNIAGRNTYNMGELSVDWPLGAILGHNDDKQDKLYIFPLLIPDNQVPSIGILPIKGRGRGVFVDDAKVWIAREDAGLALYDLSDCVLLPDASFSYQPSQNVTVRQMVEFFDQSTNYPTNWQWDFGDGTVSSEANPIHFFQEPGEYNVTLTVSNAFGNATISRTISVVIDTTVPPINIQGNFVYILPSVGVGVGSQNSQWGTLMQINDLSAGTNNSDLFLYYLEEKYATSSIMTARLNFNNNSLLSFDSLLTTIFGKISSRGALIVQSEGPLSLAAAVYNDTPSEGVLAQRIPILRPNNLLACNAGGSVDFLFSQMPVRVNLGIVNLSPEPLTVFVPDLLTMYLIEVPSFSYRQINSVYQYTSDALPRLPVEAYGEASTPGGWYAFVSVIDNRNGHPMFFPIQ